MMPADSRNTPVYVTYRIPVANDYIRWGDPRFRSVEMAPEAAASLVPAVQDAWTVFYQSKAAPTSALACRSVVS